MVKLDGGYFTDAPALTLIDLHFVCELSIQYNGLLYYYFEHVYHGTFAHVPSPPLLIRLDVNTIFFISP